MKTLSVGVDFDNTIADYDELIRDVALEKNFISSGATKNKKLIRDSIRLLPNGETEWRIVQGIIYGERMLEAKLGDGVKNFFAECTRRGIALYIVSHKTEYADFDATKTNLREVALDWMGKHGFFVEDNIKISRENVYFEPTREEKIKRIAGLRLTHFIDDLEETFQEPGFPAGTTKILYSRNHDLPPGSPVVVKRTWADIQKYLFNDCN